jgi:hypothetical protein
MITNTYSTAPDAVGLILIIGILGCVAVFAIPVFAQNSLPANKDISDVILIKEYYVLPIPNDDPDFKISDIHGVVTDMNGTSYVIDSPSSLWIQSYYSGHPFIVGQQFIVSGYTNPRIRTLHITNIKEV